MENTNNLLIGGKTFDEEVMRPFTSLDELVQAKSAMRMPPAGNVPIQIEVHSDKITVSGRLFKAGGIGHDPNIGALTIIALCIRRWEKEKPIIITKHGLSQEHLGRGNKFIQIANRLNIGLDGLNVQIATQHELYWHYEMSQEKLATIFLHVLLLNYTKAEVIYANHGGTERGYFMHKVQGPIVIEKYQEGKKYSTRAAGIEELANYSYIEEKVILPSHSPSAFIRTVVAFGSKETELKEKEIGFMLNENGDLVLGKDAPEIFKEVVSKLTT